MCTFFTHSFSAVVMGKIIFREKMSKRFWFAAMICASIPDADVIGLKFGIEYGHLLGHRGFTHSIFFAIFLALLVVCIDFKQIRHYTKQWWKMILFFFAIISSHGILDAMTDGGLGIAFFSPFDETRYFLPWRPILVPPLGIGAFFSEWGLETMVSEIKLVWLPLILLWGSVSLCRKFVWKNNSPDLSVEQNISE
ncbi:metal-dependent hydrolase [Candidatus Uabimicrobium sp. HlEnr_7]|uniref:metal-dependent hydrolase n=1 Tax=Candidatus Uabimicrobium helgolandensis TaxID=3095367 RepID=UPI003558FA92